MIGNSLELLLDMDMPSLRSAGGVVPSENKYPIKMKASRSVSMQRVCF